MNIIVKVADESHAVYAEEICQEIYLSSLERKTGIAKRTPEYIIDKMSSGKAVIALTEDGEFAGFSYIESWGGKKFVANSGLIVAHKFRGQGIAKRIKRKAFELSREKFPDAKIFGPLHLGWSVRYKQRLAHSEEGDFGKVWYVPGFGTYETNLGATFNVIIDI